jgi:hypothetical protein
LTVGSGASYEFLCFSAFLIAVYGISRMGKRDKAKAERLLAVLLVGLFFGVGWEPQGTELVWRYPGYRFYAFMDIPLALLLSWSWWMVVCRLVADGIEGSLGRVMARKHGLIPVAATYVAGALVALVIEPLSVAFGWWDYLVVGERAALHFPILGVSFNLTVIVGWGMLTTLNLALSGRAGMLASKIEGESGLGYLGSLGLVGACLGLFSGWLSWQLVGFFAAFVEGAAPRLFFTRYYIFILEGVTGGQLLGLLIATSASCYYLWSRRVRA